MFGIGRWALDRCGIGFVEAWEGWKAAWQRKELEGGEGGKRVPEGKVEGWWWRERGRGRREGEGKALYVNEMEEAYGWQGLA